MSLAARILNDSGVNICTVVGFPLGYNDTNVKLYETETLIHAGATEIDVVVNVTWIKSGQWDKVDKELEQLSALISSHNAVFKLIF